MKATIDVQDRKEAELIRAGLQDPTTRAVVKIIGALSNLPTDRARLRCLNYVSDSLQSGELISVDETSGLIASQGKIV